MCLLSLNDTEIKDSILSINNFKNNDDTIYLLEIDDFINYNDLEIMKIKNNIIYFSLFDKKLINKLTNLDNKISSVIEDIINSNNDIKVLFNDTFKYFPLLNKINDTFYIKVSNNNKTDLIKDMTIIYLKTTIQIYISSKYKCSYINQKISLININSDELSIIDYENLSNSNSDNSSNSTSDSHNSRNSDSTSDSHNSRSSDSHNSRNSDSTSDSHNSRNSDSTSDSHNSRNSYNSRNSDSSRENNVNINNKFYDDTDSSNKLSDNDYNNTISDYTDENNYDNTDSIHTDNKEENKFTISDNEDNENNKDNKDNEDKQINENNKNKEKNNNNENNKNKENNNENEKKSIKFEKVNKKTDYKCNKCGKEYKYEKTLNNHKNKCKK
jgi:hypothetical protein